MAPALIGASSAACWVDAVRRHVGPGGHPDSCSSSAAPGSPASRLQTDSAETTLGMLRRRFAPSHPGPGGRVAELRAQLRAAQEAERPARELRAARDALLGAEAEEARRGAELLVDEALNSGDFWHLQAAMQRVVSYGLPAEHVARLKAAMANFQKQQRVRHGLKKAGAARDGAQLRTAIEVALLGGSSQEEVRGAREALRALDARAAMKQELWSAVSGGDAEALRRALKRAEELGLHGPPPALLGEDPGEREAMDVARSELESLVLLRLQELSDAGNADGLAAALEEAEHTGLQDSQVAGFKVTLSRWRVEQVHTRELRDALRSGERGRLAEALWAAEAAGVDGEAARAAREALEAAEAAERQAAARAEARQQLELALHGEDVQKVASALADADDAGLSGLDVDRARAALRRLRSTAGAAQELADAAHAADLYRLRAALAAARGAGVAAGDLQAAQRSLASLEACARARREIEVASAGRDPELLSQALEDAKRAGVSREEVARASALLRSLSESGSGRELRAAMASDDLGRLRAAAGAATDAGMAGPEVEAAWQRARTLESQQWWRRQLQAATDGGDAARLQAAIQQAVAAGMGSSAEVTAARSLLSEWTTQQQARLELRLACAGGSSEAVRRARAAAERAGLRPEEELAAARRALGAPPQQGPAQCPAVSDGAPAPGRRPQLPIIRPPSMSDEFEAPPTDPKLPGSAAPQGSPCFGRGGPAAASPLAALPSPSRAAKRSVHFST